MLHFLCEQISVTATDKQWGNVRQQKRVDLVKVIRSGERRAGTSRTFVENSFGQDFGGFAMKGSIVAGRRSLGRPDQRGVARVADEHILQSL